MIFKSKPEPQYALFFYLAFHKIGQGNMKIYTAILVLYFTIQVKAAKKVEDKPITRVVCYYSSWAYKRPDKGKFTIEDIDASKCTHLIYAFAGINTDGTIKILDQQFDVTDGGFKKFNALKEQNKNLKTMIAVGGWKEGVEGFIAVSGNTKTTKAFAANAITFMNTHGFDGIDIAWEFPGKRGGKSSDKSRFLGFMRELQNQLAGKKVAKKFIISAAVAPDKKSIRTSYRARPLIKMVDFINLLTYDYHTASENVTRANAPLKPSKFDTTKDSKELNVKASVNAWIKATREPEKINLGIATYGRSYTLKDPTKNELGDAIIKAGNKGNYTQEEGFLSYYEICELENKERWNPSYEDEVLVPYNTKGDQWVTYEGPKSIKAKIKLAREMKLGGLMVSSIDTDDFKGYCGSKNVLLTIINLALTDGN